MASVEEKFRLRKNKVADLKEGKTDVYLAPKIGRSRQYLSSVFNCTLSINKSLAIHILETMAKESIKLNKEIGNMGIEKVLFLYFEKD
jgi:hypothetical protein